MGLLYSTGQMQNMNLSFAKIMKPIVMLNGRRIVIVDAIPTSFYHVITFMA